jgi:hypothetical protein
VFLLRIFQRLSMASAAFRISTFLQRVAGYFNIIWDEAEELFSTAGRSDPRVVVDTSGMEPEYTVFANDLAKLIRQLSP